MQNKFQIGEKIKYRLYDKKGKEHWFDGVIHGVRSYESNTGIIKNQTYLIDTGRDVHVDEHHFDHRDREINKRHKKLIEAGMEQSEAIMKVLAQPDLPNSKLDVEIVRQPEQIELPVEHIRSKL